MLQFTLRRVTLFIPMLFLFSVVSFAIILAPPGDFLDTYVAFLSEQQELVSQQQLELLERLREEKQFGDTLAEVVSNVFRQYAAEVAKREGE